MVRATSTSLFAGAPPIVRAAAAPVPKPPPPPPRPADENAPYRGEDGMLRIGPAPPVKKHPSAYLYLQQLRWNNGEILQGTKALDLLRLEMIPLSRQLVIGYVSYNRGREEEKSATMDMRITMSYNTLRSAKVEVVRMTEHGRSDVTLTFGYEDGAAIKTAVCIVDTGITGSFDPYPLERIKSGLREWSVKGSFPVDVSLIKAVPRPLDPSQVQAPPPNFNADDPTTWNQRFSLKPKAKKSSAGSKSKKSVAARKLLPARHASPASRELPTGEWEEAEAEESNGKKKRKSRPSALRRTTGSSDELQAMLLPSRQASVPLEEKGDDDYAPPAPASKKLKKDVKKKAEVLAPDKPVLTLNARQKISEEQIAQLLDDMTTMKRTVSNQGARIEQLAVEAAKVPALEVTVVEKTNELAQERASREELEETVAQLEARVQELETQLG